MDLEQLNTLLDHSRTFYDQVRDTSSSIQHSPVTGSVAAVELESLAAQGNHVALTTAYSQAYLYKEAALCGFDGLLRTLTPPGSSNLSMVLCKADIGGLCPLLLAGGYRHHERGALGSILFYPVRISFSR